MSQLSLWFTQDNETVSLYRSSFLNDCVCSNNSGFSNDGFPNVLQSFRGIGSVAHGHGSFRWSPAVQALSVFFLRFAATQYSSDIQKADITACLSGNSGSLATSLDYALSKQPNWLLDMFGMDENGTSLLRVLLHRENPERKRPGPVVIRLNPEFADKFSVEIYLNNSLITAPTVLEELSLQIEQKQMHRLSPVAPEKPATASAPEANNQETLETSSEDKKLPAPFNQPAWCDFFRSIIKTEILQMLRTTDIFNRNRVQRATEGIISSPFFQRIAGKQTKLISDLDFQLTGSSRLGLAVSDEQLRRSLDVDQPLRFAVDATAVPTIAIFEYLKHYKGYNIELDYRYPVTTEMVKHIWNDDFPTGVNGCVLSIAATASLYGKGKKFDYKPLMYMPKQSHRVVARKNKFSNINAGSYLFMVDIPGTSSFYFSSMTRYKIINKKNVNIMHLEPDEVLATLHDEDGDQRAVLFFPHFQLNKHLNNCHYLDDPSAARSCIEHILMLHESKFRDKKQAVALNIAIRDAWLTLLEDHTLLNSIVDSLLKNSDYLKFLKRCCGLHNFDFNATPRIPTPDLSVPGEPGVNEAAFG